MKFTFTTLLIFLLLAACLPEPVHSVSQIPNTSTSTPKIIQTLQPSQTPTPPVPTKNPRPQSPAEATIEAFGTICKPPARDWDSEISPDGHWIATICRGKYGVVDSYLRVFSVQGDKDWSINHADYVKGVEDDTDGMVYPFHWSADGKYLYVTSPSRISGCCWIGYNLLLIRLNLESGQPTEIANYIGDGIPGADFSISPSERYVLYIPQDDNNLRVLDLYKWKEKVIKLKFENTGAGYTLMSNNDEKIILVLREYPKEYQGDLTFGSLVLIDLKSGSQRKLLSGIDFYDTPMPVGWKDDDHILLQSNNKFFLLNVNTAELTETVKP